MFNLINLLPWQPGYSGLGSYIKRVIPELDGFRIQVNQDGHVDLINQHDWTNTSPPLAQNAYQNLLQKSSLLKFGVNFKKLIKSNNLNYEDIGSVYSPFLDYLWQLKGKPQLITCPDLIQTRYRITNKSFLRANIFQPLNLRSATKIITYSRHIASQLVDLGICHSRLEVIPCGINICRNRVEKPLTSDLIIIARHDKHKNLENLLYSLINFQKTYNHDGTVRIIGKHSNLTPKLYRIIEKYNLKSKIILINSLPSSELLALLRSSFALIAPSCEEGFDYPILEAKAEGIPTIITDIRVHKEFHLNSSLFFNMEKGDHCLSSTLSRLFYNHQLWNDLSMKGYELARSMSLYKQVSQIQTLISQIS